MPNSDKERLEYFFRESIGWGCFGYALLGQKPMALDIVEKTSFASFSTFKHAISPRRIKYMKGFETWKKYEKFFPMSRFTFLYEKDERDNVLILLINKKSFIQKVRQHAQDFKTILKRETNGETLLEEGARKPLLSSVFMNHEALIGIMLGYGKDNAYFFHQRSQLGSDKEKIEFCEKFQLDSAWTDEEFEEFRKKFASVGWISSYITGSHLNDLELIALPGFLAVFASPETQDLRREYLETKKAIIEYYKDKDFLETTLKLLTSI